MPASPDILYVASVPFVGGAETTQLAVLRELTARGALVRALVPGAGPLTDQLEELGVVVTVLRTDRFTNRASRYRRGPRSIAAAAPLVVPPQALLYAISRSKHTVVYCGGLRALARGTVPARLLGSRVVWHIHERYDGPASHAVNGLARFSNVVLAVSNSAARQRALQAAKDVRVVHNGVSPAFFGVNRLRADKVRISMVAHLTPLKGHLAFIDVIAALRRDGIDLRATLAGDSPYRTSAHSEYGETVRKRAHEVGISMLALRPGSMPDFASQTDVLAHLAERPEGFGRAVAEAQASGAPVVGYRWGGLAEIVEDGRTGILVEPGDLQAATKALATLAQDERLRESMGRAARSRAGHLFTEERAAREAADVILRQCL